jgi:hypothetical protein
MPREPPVTIAVLAEVVILILFQGSLLEVDPRLDPALPFEH